MNCTSRIKSFALSAMLVTAIAAGPVSANASESNTVTPVKPVQQAQQVKPIITHTFEATATALSFTDPLELASKYAPETVDDWKKTLESYKQLTEFPKDALASEAVKVEITTLATVGQAVSADAKSSTISFHVKDIGRVEQTAAHKVMLKENIRDIVKAEAGVNVIGSEQNEIKLSIAAAEIPSLLKAQLNLAKAAESKNEDEIIKSLAVLLAEYKQEINKLEDIKK